MKQTSRQGRTYTSPQGNTAWLMLSIMPYQICSLDLGLEIRVSLNSYRDYYSCLCHNGHDAYMEHSTQGLKNFCAATP